jgi:hypothetical protein
MKRSPAPHRRHPIVALVVACSVLACTMNAIPVSAHPDTTHGRNATPVGTWEVTVGLVDCGTGAPIGPTFQSLLTFDADGTMAEITSSPAFAAGQRSGGAGVWQRSGPRSFEVRSEAFILFTTAPVLPSSPGFMAGTQTISQTIVFGKDPDQWTTSDAAVQFIDDNGNVYRQMCAQAAGQRF